MVPARLAAAMESPGAPPHVHAARPVTVPAYARDAPGAKGPRLEQVPLLSVQAIVALLLLALVFAVVILPSLIGFVQFAMGRAAEPDPASVGAEILWLNVAFQVLFLALVPLAYVRLVRPRDRVFRALGMHIDARTILHLLLGAGAAVAALIGLGLVLFALQEMRLFEEDPSVLVEELERVVRANPEFVLLLPLAAGITEEIFFRGLLQPRVGLVASSLLFGLVHVGYGTWVQVVAPVVLGFFFGLLYKWTRSLWTAISAHFCFDFIQFALLFFVDEGSEPSMELFLSTGFL